MSHLNESRLNEKRKDFNENIESKHHWLHPKACFHIGESAIISVIVIKVDWLWLV